MEIVICLCVLYLLVLIGLLIVFDLIGKEPTVNPISIVCIVTPFLNTLYLIYLIYRINHNWKKTFKSWIDETFNL